MATSKKLVITIKVGSNVIANAQGYPDEQVIGSISKQIKALRGQGHKVILVSSGAVAAGRSIYQFPKKNRYRCSTTGTLIVGTGETDLTL